MLVATYYLYIGEYSQLLKIHDYIIQNEEMGNFIKFYEFNDFEYYALIVAEDVGKAKLGYKEVVADIYEEENELEPNEKMS